MAEVKTSIHENDEHYQSGENYLYKIDVTELTEENRQDIYNQFSNGLTYADLRRLGFPAIPPDEQGRFPESFDRMAFKINNQEPILDSVEFTVSHVIDLSSMVLGNSIDFDWSNDIDIEAENYKLSNFGNENMFVRGYNNGEDIFFFEAINRAISDYRNYKIPIFFTSKKGTFFVINAVQKKSSGQIIYDRFTLAPVIIGNFNLNNQNIVDDSTAIQQLNNIKIISSKLQTWIFHRTNHVIYCKIDTVFGNNILYLPIVDESDNDKVLKVVNGQWKLCNLFGIDISLCNITVTGNFSYDNKIHSPNVEISYNGTFLKQNIDYILGGTSSAIDVGTYNLIISGIGDYQNSVERTWSISGDENDDGKIDINNCKITYRQSSSEYTGDEIVISEIVVKYNGTTLTEDIDYKITDDSKLVGKEIGGYQFTIKGIGNYTKSKVITWRIGRASGFGDTQITYTLDPLSTYGKKYIKYNTQTTLEVTWKLDTIRSADISGDLSKFEVSCSSLNPINYGSSSGTVTHSNITKEISGNAISGYTITARQSFTVPKGFSNSPYITDSTYYYLTWSVNTPHYFKNLAIELNGAIS